MKLRPHLPQVLRCFNESASLARWDECLEYKVHANVHAWMGGAWDCAVDFTALHTANTTLYPTKVLDFLGASAVVVWDHMAKDDAGEVECASARCDADEDCRCSCAVDIDRCEPPPSLSPSLSVSRERDGEA